MVFEIIFAPFQAAVQGITKLQSCVEQELSFLEPFKSLQGFGSLAVDMYSKDLLAAYMPDDHGIPACNIANGDALFRAASIAVSAKDSLVTELRVRTCIEMVAYKSFHRWQKNHAALAACTPDYDDSCLDCAFQEEGTSAWTISALASVINRPIVSVYPRVNGPTDKTSVTLNTVFLPRTRENYEQPIRIMWTRNQTDIENEIWIPDHFVPLFDQDPPEYSIQEDHGQKQTESKLLKDYPGQTGESPPDNAKLAPSVSMDILEVEKDFVTLAEGGQPLEYEKFMTVFECYDKVTNATNVLDSIPKGKKENVFFLIDNSYNMQHPQKRNFFFDDCGVWDAQRGTCVKTHYILQENGDLRTCKKHKGVFCQLQVSKMQKTWMPLKEQPGPDKIVECFRYYSVLKRDFSYRRRFMWFKFPSQVKIGKIAVVEYLGKYPGPPVLHGNAKKRKQCYVRTDPRIMDKIAEQVKAGDVTPGKLFQDICRVMGSENTLRNPRQISNLKYRLKRKLQREEREQGDKDLKQVRASETQAGWSSDVSHTVTAIVIDPDDTESTGKRYILSESMEPSQASRVIHLVEDSVMVMEHDRPPVQNSEGQAVNLHHAVTVVNRESELSLVNMGEKVIQTEVGAQTFIITESVIDCT